MMPVWRQTSASLWQGVRERLREPRAMYLAMILVLAQVAVYLSLLFSPPDVHPLVSLAFVLVLGMLFLALLMGLSMSWVLYAVATLSMVYIGTVSPVEGGVYSSSLAWVPLIPLTIFYVAGARAGRLWMLLAMLMQLGMALVSQWGWTSWASLSQESLAQVSYVDFTLVSLALFLVLYVYQKEFENDLGESQARQRELQARQHELEHTAQMREHFIAMVSHELRTPMNAILGLNTLLLERVQARPQATRVLEYTRQSADHLMTVINDVLDYSQFSTGQLNARLECFALHETVKAAFELFLPRIENMRLQYTCEIGNDVPEWVQTDRHRLVQVLVNLLGNAVKFTHLGHVQLRVHVQDAGVVFEVLDTGIGIAPARQQAIFERFRQAEASIHQRYGGSGLGLAISQRLVQMLGGSWDWRATKGLARVSGSGCRCRQWLRRKHRWWACRLRCHKCNACSSFWWWMTTRSTGCWRVRRCCGNGQAVRCRSVATAPKPW